MHLVAAKPRCIDVRLPDPNFTETPNSVTDEPSPPPPVLSAKEARSRPDACLLLNIHNLITFTRASPELLRLTTKPHDLIIVIFVVPHCRHAIFTLSLDAQLLLLLLLRLFL